MNKLLKLHKIKLGKQKVMKYCSKSKDFLKDRDIHLLIKVNV